MSSCGDAARRARPPPSGPRQPVGRARSTNPRILTVAICACTPGSAGMRQSAQISAQKAAKLAAHRRPPMAKPRPGRPQLAAPRCSSSVALTHRLQSRRSRRRSQRSHRCSRNSANRVSTCTVDSAARSRWTNRSSPRQAPRSLRCSCPMCCLRCRAALQWLRVARVAGRRALCALRSRPCA